MKNPREKRILILDDDETLLYMLVDALTYHPEYNVITHHCNQEVNNIINDYQPHVIIIDYMKPSHKDHELCSIIEKTKFHTSIPIIILSAFPNSLESNNELSVDDYLIKPFNLIDLEDKINHLIYN
jgi:DNA-binding response OmpR family regulator